MNSMFSFLSAFSLPTLSNFTTYIPGLSLPDNLQKRLVSFVLRRTLGRFVQHDGLSSERVDAQVSSGKLKIQRLDLDHAAINTLLPASSPLAFVAGHIDGTDVQLPFPNLLSTPLFIDLNSIYLELCLKDLAIIKEDEGRLDLAATVLSATEGFVAQSMSRQEVEQLSNSLAGFGPVASDDPILEIDPFGPDETSNTYSAPGGFPHDNGVREAVPPASLLASIIENILAQLQVRVGSIVVRLVLPESVSGDTDAQTENGSLSDSEEQRHAPCEHLLELTLGMVTYGPEKGDMEELQHVLKVVGIEGYFSNRFSIPPLDASAATTSTLAPRGVAKTQEEELLESQTLCGDELSDSLYESALDQPDEVHEESGEIDPFETDRDNQDGSASSLMDEDMQPKHYAQLQRRRFFSLKDAGSLTCRITKALNSSTIITAEMDQIEANVSVVDLASLTHIARTWSTGKEDRETSGSTSELSRVLLNFTCPGVEIFAYDRIPGETSSKCASSGSSRGSVHERTVQQGLALQLRDISLSVHHETVSARLCDIQLLWHDGPKGTAERMRCIVFVDSSLATKSERYLPPATVTSPPQREITWMSEISIDSLDQIESGHEARFSAVVKNGQTNIAFPPMHVRIDIALVENMLSYFKKISNLWPSVSEEQRLTSSPSETSLIVSCDIIRLQICLPLQDRHYELSAYETGFDRRIVLDLRSITWAPLEPTEVEALGHPDSSSRISLEQVSLFMRIIDAPVLYPICVLTASQVSRPEVILHKRAGSQTTSSLNIPHVQSKLDQLALFGLQYFADDISRWLDAVLHGDEMSPRDNIRLVSSRFFGPSIIASPLDYSTEDLGGSSQQIFDCKVAQVNIVIIGSRQATMTLRGRGLSCRVASLTGETLGSMIDVAICSGDGWILREENLPVELIFQHANERSEPTGTSNGDLAALTLATIQHASPSSKQTSIDLHVKALHIWSSGIEDWMEDIGQAVKAPSGVFEDVTPSDYTKITITLSDSALHFYPRIPTGALRFDIKEFRLRTSKQHHALNQDYTIKSDEIKLSAAHQRSLDQVSVQTNAENYRQVAKLTNLRSKIGLQLASGQTHVEISRMDLVVGACADSMATTMDLLQTLSAAGTRTTTDESEASQNSERDASRPLQANDLKTGLRDRAFSPEAIRASEGDLLSDDLPTNTGYLAVSRKGSRSRESKLGPVKTDGIEIYHPYQFELYYDHHDEMGRKYCNLSADGRRRISIETKDCNLKIELYDGYDWQYTRDKIQTEVAAIRRRLQTIRHMIASGQNPKMELSGTSSLLFNSIRIGLPEEEEYDDSNDLAAAVEKQLEELGSDAGLAEEWQSVEAGLASNSSGQKGSKRRDLNRSSRALLEIKLLGIMFEYGIPLFTRTAGLSAELDLTITSIEALDHLPSSTWKTFLKTMKGEKLNHRSTLSRDPLLSRCQIKWFLPEDDQGSEASMKLRLSPVRMHVDQDLLDFIKRFASFSSSDDDSQSAETKSQSIPQFIQRAEISPIEIKLDYKPKRIDLRSLGKGHLGELINLFHFEESKLTLRHATIRGVSGWSSVYQSLLQIWTPDIRANQMSDLVGGAAPVRSLMQVGSGVADLILLPIDQWQKDGRIVKGIQRGGTSFAKTTTLEAMKLGAKLATGTQVILEKAENALRSDTSQSQRGEILEEGQAVTQKRSRYAEQPVGAREGLFQAYNALAKDLGSAAQTILAIPMEVHENTGSNGAGRTVIRAVPLAVVQTMMGVTNASRKTLQGIRNQLDPQVLQQLQDKYKTATDDTQRYMTLDR